MLLGRKTTTNKALLHQVRPQPRLQALTVERSVSHDEDIGMGESEDELGDDEEAKSESCVAISDLSVEPPANYNT